MNAPHVDVDLFTHVRIVMGMVIGLGITRLLTGVAGIIQHPARAKVSVLHLLWVLSILVELILYWWWEFYLSHLTGWTFGTFAFIIVYAIALFLLAALLFPDRLDDYAGWEDFFIRRRAWFFGVLALTFALDVIDTLVKRADYYDKLTVNYLAQVPLGIVLCAVGIWSANRRVQYVLVAIQLGYQAWWSSLLFNMHG